MLLEALLQERGLLLGEAQLLARRPAVVVVAGAGARAAVAPASGRHLAALRGEVRREGARAVVGRRRRRRRARLVVLLVLLRRGGTGHGQRRRTVNVEATRRRRLQMPCRTRIAISAIDLAARRRKI